MKMRSYQYTTEDLTRFSNKVKVRIVMGLVNDNYLTEKEAQEILSNKAILVKEKGMLGSLIDKLRGHEKEDKSEIVYITVDNTRYNNSDNDNDNQ